MKHQPTQKRFALFGGIAYYPGGGWYDMKGIFQSVETAKNGINDSWDFWHIVNLESMEVAEHYGATCYCEGCPPDKNLS